MKRLLTEKLINWKNKPNRKPLILYGARQVGKTWILKDFGQQKFSTVYHLDFEKNKKDFLQIFNDDLSPQKILSNISIFLGVEINIKEDFLILDEIQNIPRAITSLKYFCEEMPELAICAAGSLLGLSFSNDSFPVGKVEYLNLYPMNFEEFLLNYGNDELYKAYLDGRKEGKVSSFIHKKLISLLREYYVTGGMPEVLRLFFSNKDKKQIFIMIFERSKKNL